MNSNSNSPTASPGMFPYSPFSYKKLGGSTSFSPQITFSNVTDYTKEPPMPSPPGDPELKMQKSSPNLPRFGDADFRRQQLGLSQLQMMPYWSKGSQLAPVFAHDRSPASPLFSLTPPGLLSLPAQTSSTGAQYYSPSLHAALRNPITLPPSNRPRSLTPSSQNNESPPNVTSPLKAGSSNSPDTSSETHDLDTAATKHHNRRRSRRKRNQAELRQSLGDSVLPASRKPATPSAPTKRVRTEVHINKRPSAAGRTHSRSGPKGGADSCRCVIQCGQKKGSKADYYKHNAAVGKELPVFFCMFDESHTPLFKASHLAKHCQVRAPRVSMFLQRRLDTMSCTNGFPHIHQAREFKNKSKAVFAKKFEYFISEQLFEEYIQHMKNAAD